MAQTVFGKITDNLIKTTHLSDEEWIILQGFFARAFDSEIAKELNLTKQKVRGKRQNIYAKIGYRLLTLKLTLDDQASFEEFMRNYD